MSRKLSIVLLLFALVGGSAFASKVTNVELNWQDGFTVATITIDGPVRFSHQTEEAKDGKPFRVILDVLSATHHLGAKNFFRLPSSPVVKLRTSQFAVQPEKVVRLVFDMNAETVYKVNAGNGVVKVYFPDKSGKAFTSWTTSAVVRAMKKEQSAPPKMATAPTKTKTVVTKSKQKTASQINAEINADRMAALQSSTSDKVAKPQLKKSIAAKNVSKPVKKKTVVKKSTTRLMTSGESYGPEFDAKLLDQPTKKPASKKVKTSKKSKPEVMAKVEPKKATKVVPQKKTKKADTKKAPSVASTKKPVVVAKAEPKKVAPTKPTTKTFASKKIPATSAKTATSAAPKKANPSTGKMHANINTGTQKSMPSNKTASVTKKVKSESKATKTAVKKSPTVKVPQPTVAKASKKKSSPSKKSSPVVAKQSTKKPGSKTQPTIAKASTKKSSPSKKSSPVIAKQSTKKSGSKTQPTVAKVNKPVSKGKSTSRFRRSPTRPTKLKGTLVAEFPKRLVVKYHARNRRDPFETLINESKLFDSPIGKRLANVEGLRLVGVIESGDRPNQALVEDEGGYGYILKEGDKVQKGYVLRVSPEKVFFQIFEYGWSRTVALRIDPNK